MTVRDYGCCGGATASESSEKQCLRGDLHLDLRAKSSSGISLRSPELANKKLHDSGRALRHERGRAKTAPSRTSTSNVAIGSVAGIQSGLPVRKSNRAPWRGQAIEQSLTAPPVRGCPSCEQTSSIAKKSSPIRTSRAGISSTRIDNRPPGGISLTAATRSKSDIFNVIHSL